MTAAVHAAFACGVCSASQLDQPRGVGVLGTVVIEQVNDYFTCYSDIIDFACIHFASVTSFDLRSCRLWTGSCVAGRIRAPSELSRLVSFAPKRDGGLGYRV